MYKFINCFKDMITNHNAIPTLIMLIFKGGVGGGSGHFKIENMNT